MDFRNLLVHGYEDVDVKAVLDIAANALPNLLDTIQELLIVLDQVNDSKST